MAEGSDDWEPIKTAPEDGTTVRLKGHSYLSHEIVEVDGFYEHDGWTQGWCDERGNWFYPSHWKKKNETTGV